MSLTIAREYLARSVNYLNEPVVKQNIKWNLGRVAMLSSSACLFNSTPSIIMELARTSLFLNAQVCPQSFEFWSKVAAKLLTQEQINRFGPNTIFAVNPWHPRHVISIAAAAMAIPVVLSTLYQFGCWMVNAHSHNNNNLSEEKKVTPFWRLSDNTIRALVMFSFFTSRPVLHQTNLLFQRIVAKA